MQIKILSGHLTTQQIKAVKALLNHGLKVGKVGRTNYKIQKLENNEYKIFKVLKERNCIAAPLKWATTTATIKIKE